MGNTTTTTPRVYVGTYHKYTSGSLRGEWLDPEDCADKNAFLAACAALHSDEADPEFMFQDHEGIPEGMICESSIDEALWEWLALDEDEREIWSVYRAEVDADASFETAQERYAGRYRSDEDWAYEYLHDTHPAFFRSRKNDPDVHC